MNLHEVAHDLYGMPLTKFTSERNARARHAKRQGDADLARDIRQLRKPTKPAWLLNMLVRRRPEEVEQVLALGADLREAHETLEGDRLRRLDEQRAELTRALARHSTALGRKLGQKVTDAVARQVEDTLRAAMSDPAAGHALASGLLTDTFSSTGFGPVDLAGVVALPDAATRETARTPKGGRSSGRRRGSAKARRRLEGAREELSRAEKEVTSAQRMSSEATAHREDLEADRRRVRHRLQELDQEITATQRHEKSAHRDEEKARRRLATARRGVERAAARVERSG